MIKSAAHLVDAGLLRPSRTFYDFSDAFELAQQGFVIRRAKWIWNDQTYISCVKEPLFIRYFDKASVPFDVKMAVRGGDLSATDWLIATYLQFFDDKWRTARHMAYSTQMDYELPNPADSDQHEGDY